MSNCKVCDVDLVASEEGEGICYSCKNKSESERQAISNKIDPEIAEQKPEERLTTKIKTYKGKKEVAAKKFEEDATLMAKEGYFPVSQSYEPGTWGCGAFIAALLLCIILIGIIVFIYMLIVKPEGTLTVTYEFRASEENETDETANADENIKVEEKICPQCAETVKTAAKICRYCRYEFK